MVDSDPSSADMLSNLPEHLLLHILSFLPTKTAVATSVLSKPWQHLWTLVPAIDLEDNGDSGREAFEHIVSKALDSYKPPVIRRFRLHGRYSCSTSLDKWVSYATQRNLEELDLGFILDHDTTFVFRSAPQSCKTLVAMKLFLSCGRKQFFIGDLYLPTLKSLRINTTVFETLDPSLSGFFSSRFPLLEELVVDGMFHDDINISLPMLRRLEINNATSQCSQSYTFHVEAPSLEYLSLRLGSRDFRVENLHNLVEANVNVSTNMRGNKDEDVEDEEFLINILNALSNVRMLNLHLSTMMSLQYASSRSFFHADRIQSFHNLVKLDIKLDYSIVLLGVTMIVLSKFEYLEHLTITKYDAYRPEYRLAPPTPTHVPNCLTYRLKTFCFQSFEGSQYGMEFTLYVEELVGFGECENYLLSYNSISRL